MKRTAEQKLNDGEQARQVLMDLGGYMTDIEDRYISQMVQAVNDGESPEQLARHVYKLHALATFGMDLQNAIETGKREAMKLAEKQSTPMPQWADEVENG